MSTNRLQPPLDGSITVIPGFIDFQAEHNPSLPWVIFPSRSGSGTESISFAEFSLASHRIAHSIRPGRRGIDGEVVAVLIHCDVPLYHALLAGIIRAGLIPFPLSARNSAQGVAFMLQKTACHRIIVNPATAGLASAVHSILSKENFAVEQIPLPGLHEIFPSLTGSNPIGKIEPYPISSVVPKPNDIVLYLHSSGSTGFPKSIPQTQRIVLQWCSCDTFRQSRQHLMRWVSAALPPFHTMGIYMQFFAPLVIGEAIAVYTPQEPEPPVVPTPHNLLDVCKLTQSVAIPAVPSFVEVWAQSSETIKYLASLKLLTYAGGPLSDSNGEKLVDAGVNLVAVYGGTEFGAPSACPMPGDSASANGRTNEDWAWIEFQDSVKLRWISQGDGTFECHYLTCEGHQPAIDNLPDVKGYATSDLFTPHPTKKGLWKIVGRADDVIVLGTGEKIVPIPQESFLCSLPLVNGALMFGRGRTQAGVLIEPRGEAVDPRDENALIAFRNKIWPFIEEANKLAPTFARIFKELIIVTDPARPMARAAKGTAIRKMVLAEYEKEIEKLYETVEASRGSNGVVPPATWNVGAVEEWLMEHATSIADDREVLSTADLFEQGFDSLSATYLRNRIIGALRSSRNTSAQAAANHIPQEFVFSHPTLQKLAIAVVRLIDPKNTVAEPVSPSQEIEEMIAKYSANLPTFRQGEKFSGEYAVLLTGSTGSLGSHILANLLQNPKVGRVFTLDRASNPRERLAESFNLRGLPVDELKSDKLTCLVRDLSKPGLGLDAPTLQNLSNNITHVIHNAWKLDFNLSLGSFENHVSGVRSLLDFSASCANPAKFIFTSSIAATQSWTLEMGPVPEEVLQDPEVAVGAGYGASKYVSERLISAAKKNGLEAVSLRVGQLSGSTTSGAWNATDWVPIIIKSSDALECLPEVPGVVDWLPVDIAGRSVVDFVLTNDPLPNVVNVVHPHPVSWNDVFTAVKGALGNRLPLVPYADWLEKLEARATDATARDLNEVPAIKLLRFMRQLNEGIRLVPIHAYDDRVVIAGGRPSYSSVRAQEISDSLKFADQLGAADFRLSVQFWQRQNFL